MRQILIVQSRPEDAVADAELEAMVRFGALDESRIRRVRLDREQPHIDLLDVDGILVGGTGPAMLFPGGRMVRGIAESVAPVELSLTGHDWLTDGLPRAFTAFGGHKEGIAEAPEGATTLAVSAACVHMVRVGEHVVGTQFHPELDADGLEQRIRVYRDHGYFSPEEVDDLVAAGRAAHVTHPQTILARFTERYGLTR